MVSPDTFTAASVDSVANVIRVALTPVFLLSGIASLLGVFSTRLGRVAERAHALQRDLVGATPSEAAVLSPQLASLRMRSLLLDVAVSLGTLGGVATCAAALMLFVGTLRDMATATVLFVAFGAALFFTIGALAAFLVEVLWSSRRLRADVAVGESKAQDAQHRTGAKAEAHASAFAAAMGGPRGTTGAERRPQV